MRVLCSLMAVPPSVMGRAVRSELGEETNRDVTIHSTHNVIRFSVLISQYDFLKVFN